MTEQPLDEIPYDPEDERFQTSEEIDIPEGIPRDKDLPAERAPKSPGEILQNHYLSPLELSQKEFAETIGVTRRRVNEIVNAKRRVTPETAVRIAKATHTSPMFWLSLQDRHDLWRAHQDPDLKQDLNSVKKIV
ncbi:MAG: HigA family addiction module antitoxin [bacterium]